MYYLNLNTVIMNKNNYEEQLVTLLSPLDADLTGENGPEYVYDNYLSQGFDSNLEYYIHDAQQKHDDLKSIIKAVLKDSENFWSNYYGETQTIILEANKELIVSIAVAHG